tara:strand:+ start:301 stop:954 length:654 start_codon:yes stop_codon:yes gene_type:complete
MIQSINDYSGNLGIAIGSLSGIIIALINLGKNFFKKKKPKKVEYLKNHDIFNAMRRAQGEVKIMKFYTSKKYDKVKSKMCYDFTKHKAEQCTKHILEILNNPKIDTTPTDKLKTIITRRQNDMHVDYISAIRTDWLAKGIPAKDVDHVIHLFEKFRHDVVNSFEYRIESIFASTYHESNFSKVLAVLNMWAMGFDLLPRDMQITFENLNGKFKDIDY